MSYESHELQALEALPATIDSATDPADGLPLSPGDSAAPVLSAAEGRRDGWTGFARRLFLEVLSETGRVDIACDYCKLSRQSAYSLRARDPVFASSWDAACELARAPLADALFERAMTGVTDTITKDGEVVAERHRFDNRLSIAVLNRLDKRCDQARGSGAPHMTLVAHWEEWLSLVGKGEEDAAGKALIAHANPCQPCQLPLGENPTADDGEDDYARACTAEEAAILDADVAADHEEARLEEEELRDAWLDMLEERSRG